MNILYVASEVFFPGVYGGSRRVLETARTFVRKGHNAIVFTAATKNQKKYEEIYGFKVYRFKFFDLYQNIIDFISKYRSKNEFNDYKYDSHLVLKKNISVKDKINLFFRNDFPIHKLIRNIPAIPRLVNVIKKEKIDVIIERGGSYGLGYIASLITNRFYATDFIDVQFWRPAVKNSEVIYAYHITYNIPMYVSREKIYKLTTNTDIHNFKPGPKNFEIRKKYGIKDGELLLIYIGTMYPWHGLDNLIEAMKILKSKNAPVKTLLLGTGIVFDTINMLVKQFELENNVILVGRVNFDEVPEYLRAADVALSLNKESGLGLKNMEYMALGLPQICANVPIISQVVRNKVEGLLIPPNSPKDLARAIMQLYENPELRIQMGKNARERVVKYYSWDKHIENMIDGILKAIERIRKIKD